MFKDSLELQILEHYFYKPKSRVYDKNSELTCQGDTPTKEKDPEVMEIILA